MLAKGVVSNLKSKIRGVVRFVLDLQNIFRGRFAKTDTPHQEAVKCHIQRGGDLCLMFIRNLFQDASRVWFGLNCPRKTQQHI